jgi:AbrB family looped-hinge helix DNA binding protein
METTKLSTKGQIILPKSIREARGWKPGAEFTVEDTGTGVLLRPTVRFPRTALDEVAGCLKRKGKRKTVAQMERSVQLEAARRHDRGRY